MQRYRNLIFAVDIPGSENICLCFYFADLIFVVCWSTAKTAKITTFENFRLLWYGICTLTLVHMQMFSSVYGCGTATADKWYKLGLRSIDDVRQSQKIILTETQRVGLKYHEHISVPVSREETDFIKDYILSKAEICFPGTTVEAVGGYRR